MRFLNYLFEMDLMDKHNFKASFVFQAFLDNMKTSHYIKKENFYSFNVGKVSEHSRFNDLFLLIREKNKDNILLGKKDNKFYIVVDTSSFPEETNIKEFLEDKKIYKKIIEKIVKFMKLNKNSEDGNKTRYEKQNQYNSEKQFEEMYQKIVKGVLEKLEQYKTLKKEFEEKIEKTGNVSTVNSYKMAIKKLADDYIGNTVKEFKNKAHKVADEIDPDFREHLDKENRKLLDTRLQDFYDDLKNQI